MRLTSNLMSSLPVFLLLAGMTPAAAQSVTGSISGLVTDAQNAVLARADVTAKNIATGVIGKTQTNSAGVYNVPYLRIGTYEVRITSPGMKEAVVTGVLVDQNNISRVDVTLEVGNVNQSVQVEAAAPLLQQESTTYDGVVDRKFVEDLPVATGGTTRDPTNLALLVPGVVVSTTSGAQFGVSIGGGRQFSTEFQLDGMSVAYQGVGPGVPLDSRPDIDLISEVKVQIGVPTAEYGRTSGGVVQYISRSGTNDLHGNATMLVRNTVLNARAYNATVRGKDQGWELALSAGGPILIPKLYNGRNRTFFFFNYTGLARAPGGNPRSVTVPTSKQRGADFSELSNAIYDPLTHNPFPNNVIPTNRLSPISQTLAKLFPAPTTSGVFNNYNGLTPTSTTAQHYFAKVDHNFTPNSRLSGSFRFQHSPSILGQDSPFPLEVSSNKVFKGVQQTIVSHDLVISPRLVNHFAVSQEGFLASQDSQPLDPAYWPRIPNSFGPAFPSFYFLTDGYASLGTALGNTLAAVNSENDRARDIQDSVSWDRGKHGLKFGARYLWYQAASNVRNGRNGFYTFSQQETGAVVTSSTGSLTPVAGTGNSFASFLLGAVETGTMSLSQPMAGHVQSIGIYAQDNWKVSRRVTINYGLRFDFETPVYERGGMISQVNLRKPNPGAGNLLGAYEFGKGETGKRSFVDAWYGAYAPRLGIAYTVTPSLVLRASVGILYAHADNGRDGTGYNGSASVATRDGGVTPGLNWDQGWPAALVRYPPSLDPTILNNQNANTMARNANQWSNTNVVQIDIQKSFARNLLVNIGYLGESTHHLPNNQMNVLDQVDPKYLALGPLLNNSITSPAVTAAGYNLPYPGFTGSLAQALKPYPQYLALTPLGDAIGNSNYNALLVKVEKRFSNGFQTLASYTWSKTLTDSALTSNARPGPQDTYNRRVEKTLSLYDIPRNLIVSFTYQLPWGHGTPFFNKGLASHILGGWNVSGILNYQSGFPITLNAPNTLPLGNKRLSAVYLGGEIETGAARGSVTLSNGLTGQRGTVTLNRSAFGFPAPFTFGNVNVLPNVRLIGRASENIAFAKRQTFFERFLFEIRGELFNAFNRKEFGGLVTDLTNPAFGIYTGAGIGPRTAQITGRLVF